MENVNGSSKAAQKNLFKKVDELVSLMMEAPEMVEAPMIKAGKAEVTMFQDSNFTDQFQNLRDLKKKILRLVIEDVSLGVKTLRSSTFGVFFNGKKLSTFIEPWGSSPPGSVVFTVAWRDIKAFQNWRKQAMEEISQDQINQVVYYLCWELSRLEIKKTRAA